MSPEKFNQIMIEQELEEASIKICNVVDGDLQRSEDIAMCRWDDKVFFDMPDWVGYHDGDEFTASFQPDCTLFEEDGQVGAHCISEGTEFFVDDLGELYPKGKLDPEDTLDVEVHQLPWVKSKTRTESRPGPGRGEKITEHHY